MAKNIKGGVGMVKESIPKEGESIKIQSYKHDGNIHRVWSETTILKGTDHVIIGGNDHTLVTESDGRTWITREPAIVYFHSEYWFNVICMFRKTAFIIIAIYHHLSCAMKRHLNILIMIWILKFIQTVSIIY